MRSSGRTIFTPVTTATISSRPSRSYSDAALALSALGITQEPLRPNSYRSGVGAWQVHGLKVQAREPRFADKCGDVPIEVTPAGDVFPIRGQPILPATHAFVRRAAVLAEQEPAARL